tara:strand:- start:108 stop:326 length:219 start_codon:yes stop_codon:yes gene_type:complete
MIISKKFKIQLNGKKYIIQSGHSIQMLLKKLKIKNNKAAVEINGQIADKKTYNKIDIKKNDKIEIVHFIGGG